jgi:hypothetical protein
VTPAHCQSLTVVAAVRDGTACLAALTRHRFALEAAFARVAGVESACLAVLPALPGADSNALFLECSFQGSLRALALGLFAHAEPEIRAIFGHCTALSSTFDATSFALYLSAQARRANASPLCVLDHWARLRRLRNALLARCHWPSRAPVPDADALESRRGAVGMQDWQPGVPLLHVARLPAHARARVKRALRALEQDPVLDPRARFLLHGDLLLFFAYPPQIAWLWSERVARVSLAPLTRVWAGVPEFRVLPWLRRARRARALHRFLLDGRVPVSVWFNAQLPTPRAG